MYNVSIYFKKKPIQNFVNVSDIKTIGEYFVLLNSLNEIIFGVNKSDLEKVELGGV